MHPHAAYTSFLCRDDAAFRFWAERDRVLHTFYDENGEQSGDHH
jgi:hypothetical protein